MRLTLKKGLVGRKSAEAAEPAAFAGLPIRKLTIGGPDEWLAVHVNGQLGQGRVPILCIPGYNRNMSDFADLVRLLRRELGGDPPILLVDLRGRGRSPRRRRGEDYTTTNDARDLSQLCRALAIETAIVVGEGHGGQVAMALALERPTLLAGTVLIDAGPVIAPESLVRLRGNMQAIAGLRGAGGLTVMLRRMIRADYPAIEGEEIDRLVGRTHVISPAGAAEPLYDPALITRLADLTYDDVLAPQWDFFELLRHLPIMFIRSELTDQLPLAVLEEMVTRRPDAMGMAIDQQRSPPLLNRPEDVALIAEFVRRATGV